MEAIPMGIVIDSGNKTVVFIIVIYYQLINCLLFVFNYK